jgi:outer membrane protein assembly factor BamB
MESWQYDVFISYNRKDQPFVRFVQECLELAGLNCFRDVTGLGIYDKLDAKLKLAVSQSRWLMAIISPAYLQSYWCLFEALEAIQGQDLNLRFLPVVVRYSAEDQVLDENFVVTALKDLAEQKSVFLAQMMATKAVGLAKKVEKLSFVEVNLPQVFQQIGDRVYPEFQLWDEQVSRATMRKLINYLAPSANVDVNAVPFNVGSVAATPVVIPRLSRLPVLVWKSDVGCQAWKNTPVPIGNDVIVASSGRGWNEPDERDGIYCLHGETGKIRWFHHTAGDANHLLVSKGTIVTGCDDGTVAAIRLVDGKPQWSMSLGSAITGGPIKLSSDIGNGLAIPRDAGAAPPEPVLITTFDGGLHILDLDSGRDCGGIDLGHELIGSPMVFKLGYREMLAIPARDGSLLVGEYDGLSGNFRGFESIAIAAEMAELGFGESTNDLQLAATPCFAGGLILQGVVRDTYYDDPPLVAVDPISRKIRWVARAAENSDGFGNLRGVPVVVGDDAVMAPAYTSGLVAVSVATGKTAWSVELGQAMFEQWSAPIAVGRSIFIGRHDGYLHKVSSERRRREWSMFLGDERRAGAVVGSTQEAPEFADRPVWAAGGSSPILATPAADRGRIYVGTHQGWLYCIGNLGDDSPNA